MTALDIPVSSPHSGVSSSVQNTPEDWSFAHLKTAETLWGPHGYHRYPAKFIPHLVRRIIDRYSVPDALVADPFLGSATTGVEALRAKRRFYGSEINPVALIISQAKCRPLEPAMLEAAWAAFEQQLNSVPRLGRRELTAEERNRVTATNISHATAEERFHYWFPTTVAPLEQILCSIKTLADPEVQTFFLCGFSNILRGCSIWLSGSTKPQKDLEKTICDPVDAFRSQIRDMLRRNRHYWENLVASGVNPVRMCRHLHLELADAKALSLNDKALDLLVTSPPYATCYEYLELHQLTQLWLERSGILAPNTLKQACIGGKRLTHRAQLSGKTLPPTGSKIADNALRQLSEQSGDGVVGEARALQGYFQDMHTVVQEFARLVRGNGHLVLIIGDSYKRGVNIPTSAALCEMALEAGFNLEQKIVRKIPVRVLVSMRDRATGKFSATATSDTQVYPEEDVLVFRRRITRAKRTGGSRG